MSTPSDDAPPTSGKAELRAWVRARRRALPQPLPPAVGQDFARAVMGEPTVGEQLRAQPQAPVLVYVEARGEPPTDALRARLRESGATVFIPWARPDRELLWLRDNGAAEPWGLPGVGHPPEADAAIATDELLALRPRVMVLPALAATPQGARLGQGGGYYDTLLSTCLPASAGGPLRVALVWPWEVLDRLPVEPHDQGVDLVVSCWPQ